MKKYFFKIRNFLPVLLITGVMTNAAIPAAAKKQKESIPVFAAVEPKLELIENSGDTQLLKLSFDADSSVKFELTISDDKGEVWYSDDFEAASFSKYVKLVNEGQDQPGKIYFTLRNRQSGMRHVFSISNETMLLKDVVITKL